MTRIGWCPGGRPVADMLKLYPEPGAVRLFYGFRDPVPTTWGGPDLDPLGPGVLPLLSFKVWNLPAMLALAGAIPPGVVVGLSYHHEDEQQDGGDIPPELFVSRWVELARAFEGHPKRDQIILAPIYTRYWWEKHPGDLRYWPAEVAHLLDAVGWDVYNNGSTYRTPDDLLRIPREMAARTGLPYFVGELGAVDVGPGRSEWMRAMVAAARADGALAVCWFHKDEWDLVPYPAEQQTWRELTQEEPMPTYAQLQAEPYWGREVVTPAMDWLGDELCRRTGRPREAAGTKGDRYHLRGAHRSQEWIKRSVYCTNRTYTVQPDLGAEMQRWIAGFDFTPGSAADMIAQSKRIYAAMKRGQLDEVREFYGNVDGDQVVDGWDNVADRAASSDSSHLWHWHLSVDRRHCNNQQLMERILAIALGEPLEDDMTPADLLNARLRDPIDGQEHTVGDYIRYMEANVKEQLAPLLAEVTKLRALVGAEGTNPTELAGALAGLPKPEPVDVDGLAAALAPKLVASLPGDSQVTDEQLERVLRSTLGSLNDAPQS